MRNQKPEHALSHENCERCRLNAEENATTIGCVLGFVILMLFVGGIRALWGIA